jgi:Fe-S cluster assembly protein SufB
MAYHYRSTQGLDESVVATISEQKNEPGWMTDFRLEGLELFKQLPMPTWGPDLSGLKFDDLHYYLRPIEHQQSSWEGVPKNIKTTFEKLGIPQAEQQYLAGVGAQYESEVVYKQLQKQWSDKGVVFCDMTQGLRDHPEIFKKYFASVIASKEHKFAALNSAVWSGGSYVYVPPGVHVDMPLQAYFRMNTERMGQFERTLIIADEGANVHYVEGCSAPVFSAASLHSAVVELVALPGSTIRYTTIQNWASNVYNLVTKRAIAKRNATVVWVDGNFGSRVTMKYPSVVLAEPGAKAEIISIARANAGQEQDAGGKIIHLAPHTTSTIISKSISVGGGKATYRGLLKVAKNAHDVVSRVRCDALMLDSNSHADAYPTVDIANEQVDVGHEASVNCLDELQLFYLMSRGLSAVASQTMIVTGFIAPLVDALPMEYAVEINRLIAFEMEGSIG